MPEMTVLENLRVGNFETRIGWRIPWRRERQRVRESLRPFGLGHIEPEAEVRTLREVERALIAIVRALDRLKGEERGVLVLDEPTAYLPRDGVERLFAAVRTVAPQGIGVLFVTHRLEEVRALADRVTILRDGAHVETAATASLSEHDLIERILGQGARRALSERARSAGRARAERATTSAARSSARSRSSVHRGRDRRPDRAARHGPRAGAAPPVRLAARPERRRQHRRARLRPAPHVAARRHRRRPRAPAREPAPRGRGAGCDRDRERDAHDAAVVLHAAACSATGASAARSRICCTSSTSRRPSRGGSSRS